MTRGGRRSIDALLLALFVLSFRSSRRAERGVERMLAGRLPWRMRRLWVRYQFTPSLIAKDWQILAAYAADATQSPRLAVAKDSKALGSPTAYTLGTLHRAYFDTPDAKVWQIPFQRVLLDVLTYHHAQGRCEIISERKAAFLDRVAKIAAERQAAKNPPPAKEPAE